MQLKDATLREGEQRLGTSYTVDQKVEAARKLDELGVDGIQIGFPRAGDGTKEVIDQLDTDAKLLGLARSIERDIDALFEAGVDELSIGIPTSEKQREAVLGITQEEAIDFLQEKYDYAKDYGLDVAVNGADSFRADPAFLNDLIDATDTPMFTLLDTVGIATPIKVDSLLDSLECDPNRLGVHFHRDLGVATANVLTAAARGVAKADVTVGGIGDRVGNVALEEVVAAGSIGPPEIEFNVDTDRLVPLCQETLGILGEEIPPHKAILGSTAYEHESGMHTANMLDDPSTYEPFNPNRFGGERRLLFGPSSGRGAARRLLKRAGLEEPSEEAVQHFRKRLNSLDENVGIQKAMALAEAEISG